ncbi:hypothetical protein BDV12DRAFT_179752 [Aspergillus spectabilis]
MSPLWTLWRWIAILVRLMSLTLTIAMARFPRRCHFPSQVYSRECDSCDRRALARRPSVRAECDWFKRISCW